MKIPHPLHKKGEYYMEKELHKNIMPLNNRIKNDSDVVGVICGSPGEGKDTIAQQLAYVLDPNFCMDQVYWTYEDYVGKTIDLFDAGKSKGRAAIHSEGKEAMSSATVMSKRTRNFMNFMYENRQMNMIHLILTGDFFDIPKAIAMQRVLFMIFVHEEGEFQKGYFKFFNRRALRRLYIVGKKYRNMEAVAYSFRGYFPRFYTVDEELYRRVKASHLKRDRFLDTKKEKALTIKSVLEWVWDRNPEPRPKKIMDALNIGDSTYFAHRKTYNLQTSTSLLYG